MIRTLRTTDLLRALLSSGGIGPDWAHTWEKMGGTQDIALSPTTVVRGLVLHRRMECCSVWAEGVRLRALASVRTRSGPRAWEVGCLHLSPAMEDEGVELLERLCMAAGQHGGERVFLRMPTGSPVLALAKRAGFLPYARETLYRRESPFPIPPPPLKFLRPYLPSDEYALFRLYNACAPSKLRAAHGVTFEEWRDAQEPLAKGEQQQVYEAPGCLKGWIRVVPHQRSATRIELMLHPEEEASTCLGMLAWGLQQGKAETPFLALVAEHQSTLALVLERGGFVPSGEYRLMVKSIAVRVSEPALAPAGA